MSESRLAWRLNLVIALLLCIIFLLLIISFPLLAGYVSTLLSHPMMIWFYTGVFVCLFLLVYFGWGLVQYR
jgi:uncharacterized membrane protein (DUF485 family)